MIDTGPGIAPAETARVFDKFHQMMTHDTLSDKPKGTGLGLSISKQIVEHYGGSIWVKSLVGEGSTFGFRIPSFRGPDQIDFSDLTAPGHARPGQSRILVVEDDTAFRTYLQRVLSGVGPVTRRGWPSGKETRCRARGWNSCTEAAGPLR